MVHNQQSNEQPDTVNFNSQMSLVNNMEMDSVEVISQMDNQRQNRKRKQNFHEIEDVPNKVSQATSTESADVRLSGMPNDDESQIPIQEVISKIYSMKDENELHCGPSTAETISKPQPIVQLGSTLFQSHQYSFVSVCVQFN